MVRELTIREARPADVAAIQRVARTGWHAAYDDLLGSATVDSVVERAYPADGLRAEVAEPGHVFLVATTAGEPVGFAHAVPDGASTAELARIYVDPGRWNEGIGGTLLARVEYLLGARGFDRLRLEVFAENEVGVSFYESSGFERVAESEIELGGESYEEYVYAKGLRTGDSG